MREATGLKANHVWQAIQLVIRNAKAVKQVHKFRPTSLSLDVRTFQYIEETQSVGVTLMFGRFTNCGCLLDTRQISLLAWQG